MRTRPNWTGIHVGATLESVTVARNAIIDILNTGEKAGEAAKVEALKALSTLCAVGHTTIQNVEIRGPK